MCFFNRGSGAVQNSNPYESNPAWGEYNSQYYGNTNRGKGIPAFGRPDPTPIPFLGGSLQGFPIGDREVPSFDQWLADKQRPAQGNIPSSQPMALNPVPQQEPQAINRVPIMRKFAFKSFQTENSSEPTSGLNIG